VSPRPALLRGVRRLGWIAAGLLGLYLIAGNLFLNTPVGPWAINRKPDRFQMQWSHGLTWWPGCAMLWNVEVGGHVRRVVWNARAARGHGRIALLPLFGRELRLASIDASEVTGSLHLTDQDRTPPPPRPGGWSLRFDRIATDSLRTARIGAIDIATQGQVAFGFYKQLRGGPLEIYPSQARLDALRVTWDGRVLLHDGAATARFALPRHRREDASGLAKLGLADAALDLHGALPGLAVDLDDAGRITGTLDPAGTGTLAATLGWQRGALTAGGTLALRVPLQATRPGAAFDNEATLRLAVEDEAIRIDATLPRSETDPRSIDARLVLAGTAVPLPPDPQQLLARLGGEVALDWRFGSLAWLGPLLLKAPWLQLEGAGAVEARLLLERGLLRPGSTLRIPDVAVAATVAGHRFDGQAHAEGQLVDAAGTALARIDLAIDRFDVAAVDAPGTPLVRGRDLRIDLEAPDSLAGLRESLKARLRFEQAEIPDLRAFNPYLPRNELRLLAGRSRISGDLHLDAAGEIASGRVSIEGRGGQARLGRLEFAGDFDLDGRLARADIASGRFDLDGSSLRLRKVRVADAGRTAGRDWWASIGIVRGHVEAGRPLALRTDAAIEMENIGLLLALFAERKDYPRWVLGLVDAGRLRARGLMQVRGDAIVFDRVEAANDRFEVKTRMRIAGGSPVGDLLLRWRALSVGVELRDDTRDLHLLRAADWYAQRPHLLGPP